MQKKKKVLGVIFNVNHSASELPLMAGIRKCPLEKAYAPNEKSRYFIYLLKRKLGDQVERVPK